MADRHRELLRMPGMVIGIVRHSCSVFVDLRAQMDTFGPVDEVGGSIKMRRYCPIHPSERHLRDSPHTRRTL